MDLTTKEVAYKQRPWEFQRRIVEGLDDGAIDSRDAVPWESRQWYLDFRTGSFSELECVYQNGVKTGVLNPHPGGPLYSRDEVEEAFKIAEEHDCTIAEAAIAIRKEGFTEEYLQKVLKSSEQAKPTPKKKTSDDRLKETPDVEFADPRFKKGKPAAKASPKPKPLSLKKEPVPK